jgi:hypothetical protein
MPAAVTSFDTLIAAVVSTLNRGDLADEVAGWISFCEDRFEGAVGEAADIAETGAVAPGGVRIREMLTRSTSVITARYIALPTGFLEMKRLRTLATATSDPFKVEQVTPDEITEKRQRAVRNSAIFLQPSDRPVNLPNYYAIENQIEFDVDPSEFDDDLPYAEFLYYQKLTRLSASNASNVLLARSPSAYFYGTLVHSAPFLLDDARIQTWEAAYQTTVGGLNATDRKRAGSLISRVPGPTP